jgi:hypothetical protein
VASVQRLAQLVRDRDELRRVAQAEVAHLGQRRADHLGTMRPGRGDITTMRVDRYTASAIEWVTKTTVRFSRCHSCCSCSFSGRG